MVKPQTFKEAKSEQPFIAQQSVILGVGINDYSSSFKIAD